MYYISKETALTPELLHKIINRFVVNDLPRLEKWDDYYAGRHAILHKSYKDESKPCNLIVTNYCKIIVDTYSGYIVGKPVTYAGNESTEQVQQVLNYNDSSAEDIAFLDNALIYGIAYELHWIDEDGQHRYAQVSPLQGFAICDNSLEGELLYFVRWYDADNFDDSDKVIYKVYSKTGVTTYEAHGMSGQLLLKEQEKPHFFKDVPVSVFYYNEARESIFAPAITLNDAYNELQSAEVDDYQEWVDSYLSLVGVDATRDDITSMKENRVLLLPEGATASWLTKAASDTQIVNMLDNIKKNIFKVTSCPDMADETFLAQSGSALAYKLVGFEHVAAGIAITFTNALQRRIKLICNILNLKGGEVLWRDIAIHFVRNLPVNLTETIQLINSLQGIVSNRTLLAQLPFVRDVEAELEAVEEQKKHNMELYSFGDHAHTEAEDEPGEDEEAAAE